MPPIKKGYKVGESVFGLWPGSGGLYFKAVVVEHDAKAGTYDLKFEEGTVYTLLEKHVKPMDSFKAVEPKTGKRATAARSRGRSASASRSRSRSRTPGRKPVGRPPGSPNKASSPKQSPKQEAKPAVAPSEDVPPAARRSSRMPKKEVKEEVKEEPSSSEDLGPRRRSTRLAVKAENAKADLSSSFEKKRNGPNDSKNDSTLGRKGLHSDDSAPKSLNGLMATLHTLLILGGVTVFHLACLQNKCLFQGIQVNQAQLASLYHPCIFSTGLGFYLLIFLLSLVPVGNAIHLSEGLSFRRNSIVSLLALIASMVVAKRYYTTPATLIMKHVHHFLLPNFVVGFLMSCVVAYRTRGSGDQGFLSHFVIGTSPTASLAGVNIKIWFHRSVCLTAIALNGLTCAAQFERTGSVTPMLGLVAGMQIVHALEALINENHILHSYEFLHVKTGWMFLSSLARPLMTFLITMSIVKSGINLPYYCLAPIGVAFLAGLWIKIGSNVQKAAFLKDPNNPAFSNMEALTTSSGEKLLISGWFGWLRQPDYLGDILMNWAFVLPCGYQMVLPHVVALFMTTCLLYRAYENDAASKLKYGPSWDRYCQRVPSRVIPRVF